MKNIIKILLVLIIIVTLEDCKKTEEPKPISETPATTLSEPLSEEEPPTTQEISNPTIPSPATFKNIKEAKGDLDGDKEDELVAIYDTKREGDLGTEREIHIFKKKADKWNLLHKSIGAVLPSRNGGMMGDPFEDLTIENGTLVIRHFGGSREKWNYAHRYRFQKDNWFLIGATIEYFIVCEESSSYDYNVSTGKVNVTETKESCDGDGNPKGKPKVTTSSFTLKDKKSILMDGFVPGSGEVKLSKEKSFYF